MEGTFTYMYVARYLPKTKLGLVLKNDLNLIGKLASIIRPITQEYKSIIMIINSGTSLLHVETIAH